MALSNAEKSVRPEELFTPTNIDASDFILNANANGGRYTAAEKITAGYAQVEVPVTARLQLIGGARVEQWHLDLDALTTQGALSESRRRNTDILPAAGADLPPDARPESSALGHPDALPARVP